MGYRAMQEGAAEVDKRRYIFQSDDPMALTRAVRAIVRESLKPQQAHDRILPRTKREVMT